MELGPIPKTFWYSASISLLAFTFGFIYISYSLGDMKVKFKDLEIRSTAVTSLEKTLEQQKKNIAEQEKTIARRETEVKELNALLEGKLEEIKGLKEQVARLEAGNSVPDAAKILVDKIDVISSDSEFLKKISEKQDVQNELQLKQDALQRDYQLQKDVFQQVQQQQIRQ